MVKVQEWLDKKYPKEKRFSITKLDISNKNLEGELKLEGFINLERLDCSGNFLTNLDLTSFSTENLTELNVDSNNFSFQDLSQFSCFINLEKLYLGTVNRKRVQQNIYNRFTGSLEFLENLTKLKELGISNTDINAGLGRLISNDNLKKIYCVNYRGEEAGCKAIQEELKNYFNKVRQCYDLQAWKKVQVSQSTSSILLRNSLVSSSHSSIITDYSTSTPLLSLPNQQFSLIETNESINPDSSIEKNYEKQKKEELANELRLEGKGRQFFIETRGKPFLTHEHEMAVNVISSFSSDYLRINKENRQKEEEIKELKKTLELREKIAEQIQLEREQVFKNQLAVYKKLINSYLLNKENGLKELKDELTKEEWEWFETYCEAREELQKNDNSFIRKQLEKSEKKLLTKLNQEELQIFWEVNQLNKKLNYLEIQENQQFQTHIQIPPKQN